MISGININVGNKNIYFVNKWDLIKKEEEESDLNIYIKYLIALHGIEFNITFIKKYIV